MVQVQSVIFDAKLLDHIQCGRTDKAKAIINEDLAKASDSSRTLLHYAVESIHDNEAIVRHLLALGCAVDPSEKDTGDTPLMMAVRKGNAAVVNVLLEANANIDVVNIDNRSALEMCFDTDEHGDIIAAFFRQIRKNVTSTEQLVDRLLKVRCTLVQATYSGDVRVLNCMLKRGIDIDSRGHSQQTALQVAAKLNDLTLVKWLVDNGADVNTSNEVGCNALFEATWNRNTDMVRYLLEHGAESTCANGLSENFIPLRAVFYTVGWEAEKIREEDQLDECTILLLQHGGVPERGEVGYNHVKPFDLTSDSRSDNRKRMVVAHLALIDMLGMPVAKSLEHIGDEVGPQIFADVQQYYHLCQEMLKIRIFRSSTLFDLLNVSDYKMGMYARNEQFVIEVEEACSKHNMSKLYSYYYTILMKRIAKASRLVQLENRAIGVLSDIFQKNYNESYIAARTVTNYLNESDLEDLGRVTRDRFDVRI
ncbi:ankyrin-2-like [Phymastichus coffea]|uniref:ankyrin-2-like n=1 Tax=Phymastichus coffea TaxID=108790 RepID=UPI00273CBB0D|nr:ankyrin-2-like [Phymastichus coffea]